MADPFNAFPIPSEEITDLPVLNAVDVDKANDKLLIRDVSENADKQVSVQDVVNSSVGLASTSTAGITQYATRAQTVDRTANNLSVTPDGLDAVIDPFDRDKTPQLFKKTPTAFFGKKGTSYSAILMIGDSNGEGAGSSADSYPAGYMGQFMRAVVNSLDHGAGTDRGFRYESVLNMSKSGIYGITATGNLISGGMCDSRLQLGNGNAITITGREISTADVFYEASLSSGSLEFRLNGASTPYKTVTITGTGTKNTYPSNIIGTGFYIKETDTVEIKSVGGTVVITEILAIRSSVNSPLLYSMVRQGWGFGQFTDSARVTEAAAHVNAFAGAGQKLVVICLGTNNQSSVVGTQLSPAAYITALDAMITAYRTALTVSGSITKFAVWVPHETMDSRPLGTYREYIDAIVAYCDSTIDVQCIRLDMSAVGYEHAYLADNRHFNDFGHAVVSRFLCDSFGVPQKFDIPTSQRYMYAAIDYTPAVYGGTTAGLNSYATGSTNMTKYLVNGSECNFASTITLTAKGTAGNAMAGVLRLRCTPIAGQGGNKPITVSRFTGVTFSGGYTQLGAVVVNGTTAIALIKSGSGLADAELTIAEIADNFSITLGGSFLAQ